MVRKKSTEVARARESYLPLAAIMLDVRTSFSLAETLNDSPVFDMDIEF